MRVFNAEMNKAFPKTHKKTRISESSRNIRNDISRLPQPTMFSSYLMNKELRKKQAREYKNKSIKDEKKRNASTHFFRMQKKSID